MRLQGFSYELKAANLTIDDELIEYGEPNLQGGEIATQKILAKGKPFSAIFVYNAAMAIDAISTLEDNGFKVPSDISVIGFDDVLLSRYSRPKLTTLHYPIEKMAKKAALLALQLANKNSEVDCNHEYKYIPQLIKRESTVFNTDPYNDLLIE